MKTHASPEPRVEAGGGEPARRPAAQPEVGIGVAWQELPVFAPELGPGEPLAGAGPIASAVGADTANVRVHTDARAAAQAREMDAEAFTVGNHVVFGQGAYRPGTLAGDVLLAHELVHVAQQADAVRGGATQIAPESGAAERAADRQTIAAVAGRRLGGVARTGLALQRCPARDRAMSGERADELLATVPLIQNTIASQNIKGAQAIQLYEDFDDYVRAMRHEMPGMALVFVPHDPAKTEQLKDSVARDEAEQAPGFTNRFKHQSHIYAPGAPSFTTIHELIHLHTDAATYDTMGDNFVEGAADYFTAMVCKANHLPFESDYYAAPMHAVGALARVIGDQVLAYLVFNGAVKPAQEIVDSKGPGTWKAFVKAFQAGDYLAAEALLEGVPAANAVREKSEAVAGVVEAQQHLVGTFPGMIATARADDRARPHWPKRHHAVTAHVVSADQHRVLFDRGGRDGVREGWIAHLRLADAREIDVPVTVVHDRTSSVALEYATGTLIVGPVVLRPR